MSDIKTVVDFHLGGWISCGVGPQHKVVYYELKVNRASGVLVLATSSSYHRCDQNVTPSPGANYSF